MKEALAKAPGHQDRRDLRHQGRHRPLRGDHRDRHRIAIRTSAAWISVGGWPVFTRNALAAVDPAKTKVISFDTIQPALDLLQAKARCRCCSARSTSAGAASRSSCSHDIKKGKMPPAPIIDSGVDVVTKDNVDAYIAEFKRLEEGK